MSILHAVIFHLQIHSDLVTGGETDATAEGQKERLGKLAVFSGVSEFPVRVKCATLPWHTFRTALRGVDEVVSTE